MVNLTRTNTTYKVNQQKDWLIISATGKAMLFDEEEMMRKLNAGAAYSICSREWQMMTAIAAVLDYERERAARINKTEL